MFSAFPSSDNFVVVHSGKVSVKFNGEVVTRSFLTSSRKPDWKLRFCELVLYNDNNYYILVYKIKRAESKVPYFKVELDRDTQLHTFDLFDKYFFDLASDQTASFFAEESVERDEWAAHIEACVNDLKNRSPPNSSSRSHSRSSSPVDPSDTMAEEGNDGPRQLLNASDAHRVGVTDGGPGGVSHVSRPYLTPRSTTGAFSTISEYSDDDTDTDTQVQINVLGADHESSRDPPAESGSVSNSVSASVGDTTTSRQTALPTMQTPVGRANRSRGRSRSSGVTDSTTAAASVAAANPAASNRPQSMPLRSKPSPPFSALRKLVGNSKSTNNNTFSSISSSATPVGAVASTADSVGVTTMDVDSKRSKSVPRSSRYIGGTTVKDTLPVNLASSSLARQDTERAPLLVSSSPAGEDAPLSDVRNAGKNVNNNAMSTHHASAASDQLSAARDRDIARRHTNNTSSFAPSPADGGADAEAKFILPSSVRGGSVEVGGASGFARKGNAGALSKSLSVVGSVNQIGGEELSIPARKGTVRLRNTAPGMKNDSSSGSTSSGVNGVDIGSNTATRVNDHHQQQKQEDETSLLNITTERSKCMSGGRYGGVHEHNAADAQHSFDASYRGFTPHQPPYNISTHTPSNSFATAMSPISLLHGNEHPQQQEEQPMHSQQQRADSSTLNLSPPQSHVYPILSTPASVVNTNSSSQNHGSGEGAGDNFSGGNRSSNTGKGPLGSAGRGPPSAMSRSPPTAGIDRGVAPTASLLLREVQALSTMNDELNEALEACEERRAQEQEALMKQVHLLQSMLDDEEANKSHWEKEKEELKSEIGSLQGTAAKSVELTKQLAESSECITTLTFRIKELEASEHEKVQQLAHHSAVLSENAELSAALDATQQLLNKTEEAYRLARESLEGKDMTLEEKTQLIADGQQSIVLLERENANHLSELARLRRAIEEDENRLQAINLRETVQSLQTDLHKIQMEAMRAKSSEEAGKSSCKRLESLVKEQQLFIDELNGKVQTLQEYQREAAALSERAEEAESATRKIETELRDTQEQLEKVRGEGEVLRGDLARTRDALIQQREQAGSEVEAVGGKLKAKDLDIAHLNSEISVLQRRLELSRDAGVALEKDLTAAHRKHASEHRQHVTQRQRLEESLNNATQTIRELQERCVSLQDTHSGETSSLTRRLQFAEDMIASCREANKDLTNKIKLLEEEKSSIGIYFEQEKSAHSLLKEKFSSLEGVLESERERAAEKVALLEAVSVKDTRALDELRDEVIPKLQQAIEAEREKSVSSNREMAANLAAAESANSRLRAQIVEASSERTKERQVADDRIAAQIAANESLQLKVCELERALSALSTQKNIDFQTFSTKEMDMQTKVIHFTSENENLCKEMTKLSEELRELRTEKEKLFGEFQSQGREILDLTAQKDTLSALEMDAQEKIRALTEQWEVVSGEYQLKYDSLLHDYREMETKYSALREDFARKGKDLTIKLDSATEQCTALQQDNGTLETMLQDAHTEVAQLSAQLQKVEGEVAEKRVLIERNRNALDAFEHELQRVKDENKHFVDSLNSAVSLSQSLEEKLEKALEEIETKTDEITAFGQDLVERDQKVSDLQKRLRRAEDCFKEASGQIATLQEEMREWKELAAHREAQCKESEERNLELEQRRIPTIVREQEELRQEYLRLKDAYETEGHTLRGDLDKVRGALEQAHSLTNTLTAERDGLAAQIDSLTEQMDIQRREAESVQKETESRLSSQIQDLTEKITQSSEEITDLVREKTDLTAELDTLKGSTLAELVGNMKKIRAENSELTAENDHFQAAVRLREAELEKLSASSSQRSIGFDKLRDALTEQVSHLRDENTRLIAETGDLNYLLNSKDKELATQTKTIALYKHQLDTIRELSTHERESFAQERETMIQKLDCLEQVSQNRSILLEKCKKEARNLHTILHRSLRIGPSTAKSVNSTAIARLKAAPDACNDSAFLLGQQRGAAAAAAVEEVKDDNCTTKEEGAEARIARGNIASQEASTVGDQLEEASATVQELCGAFLELSDTLRAQTTILRKELYGNAEQAPLPSYARSFPKTDISVCEETDSAGDMADVNENFSTFLPLPPPPPPPPRTAESSSSSSAAAFAATTSTALFSSSITPTTKPLSIEEVKQAVSTHSSLLHSLIDLRRTECREATRGEEDAQIDLQGKQRLCAELERRVQLLDGQAKTGAARLAAAEERRLHELNAAQEECAHAQRELQDQREAHRLALDRLASSHEKQMRDERDRITKLADQRIAELKAKLERELGDAEGRHEHTQKSLQADVRMLEEENQQLKNEVEDWMHNVNQTQAENKNHREHAETLQRELHLKISELERCQSQMEKTEMHAAKESRLRQDLERTLRRLGTSSNNSIHNNSYVSDSNSSGRSISEAAKDNPVFTTPFVNSTAVGMRGIADRLASSQYTADSTSRTVDQRQGQSFGYPNHGVPTSSSVRGKVFPASSTSFDRMTVQDLHYGPCDQHASPFRNLVVEQRDIPTHTGTKGRGTPLGRASRSADVGGIREYIIQRQKEQGSIHSHSESRNLCIQGNPPHSGDDIGGSDCSALDFRLPTRAERMERAVLAKGWKLSS